MAQVTEAEAGIRKAAVELERQRTEVEPKGRRDLTEGQRDEAQLEEWSPEATDGQSQTKAEPEGRGSPAEPVDCRATAERRELGAMMGAAGSTGRGGVWDSEAGGRDRGFSSHQWGPGQWG